MKQRVSVLMPVYNTAPFLKEAIESILSQTYRDFEFIIINDGSTDNSKAIIEEYKDDRIKFINNEKNLGIIKTRNLGLSISNGEYIVCMDSDDISLPTRIEKQIHYLDAHPDVAVIASKLLMINEDGKEKGYWDDDFNNVTTEQIKTKLPVINCIGQPTVMMRSAVVKHLGGYNPSFINNEDWGLWLSVLSEGYSIDKLNEVLLKYRVHTSSATANSHKGGVRKNIIRFKYVYLTDKIYNRKLKRSDYKVLFSFFKDMFKYFLPSFYYFITKVYSTNPLLFIRQFKLIRKQFISRSTPFTHIFFFPFYHIGGAEAVHASIIKTVSDKKPIVLITSASEGAALLPEFRQSAMVFDIAQLLIWPLTKQWLIKKIKTICNNEKKLILFGCNSRFFYDLILDMPSHTKAIDLIHAFAHKHEDGSENWSLPVVPKLLNRVVINYNTKKDLEELYKPNNIPDQFINRIVCITNFVKKNFEIRKDYSEKLKIIFVGRGTSEKRVHLVARTARLMSEQNIKLEFHFVGNVKKSINPEDLPYCTLHGEVTNRNIMDSLYSKAHILLLTSTREGFPMVIMEAMMHGVVPVSTNVGGISEHINNNTNGILISATEDNEIVTELIKTINYFINNRDELKRISLNAHQYALKHFDDNHFIESYQKLLSN